MPIIGKIIKAQGIKGEVKVESYMDSPECFTSLKSVIIKSQSYEISHCRVNGNFVYIKFVNVNTMNDAESLRNASIGVAHDDLPTLKNGRFYIYDLIDCAVTDGENDFGKIKDVLQYGAADVIVCVGNGKRLLFPWIKDLAAKIDVDNKIFVVDPVKFREVVCYED